MTLRAPWLQRSVVVIWQTALSSCLINQMPTDRCSCKFKTSKGFKHILREWHMCYSFCFWSTACPTSENVNVKHAPKILLGLHQCLIGSLTCQLCSCHHKWWWNSKRSHSGVWLLLVFCKCLILLWQFHGFYIWWSPILRNLCLMV